MKIKILKKKSELPLGFIIGLSFAIFVFLYLFSYRFLPETYKTCKFKKIFSIPCPSCGGTRMAFYLLKGKIGKGFLENPLFFLIGIFLFIYAGLSLFLYIKGYQIKIILNKKENLIFKFFLIFLLFSNWIYLIIKKI